MAVTLICFRIKSDEKSAPSKLFCALLAASLCMMSIQPSPWLIKFLCSHRSCPGSPFKQECVYLASAQARRVMWVWYHLPVPVCTHPDSVSEFYMGNM